MPDLDPAASPSRPTTPDARPVPAVEEELLLGLYVAQGRRVPLAVAVGALLVALVVQARVPHAMAWGWFGAVAGLLAARWAVLGLLARRPDWPLRRRLAVVTGLSALAGLVHASLLLSWPWLGEAERIVVSVFLMGLCAGALGSTLGFLPVFTVYAAPVVTGLAAGWTSALAGPSGSWWRGASAVMLAFFAMWSLILVLLARDMFRLQRDNLEARHRLALALEAAESANRAKTRFLASASHDLRQPMHALMLFSAALGLRPLDARSRELVGQMDEALQVVGSQLDTLLDISRLDAGLVPVQSSPVPLAALLRRLADGARARVTGKGLVLVLDLPRGGPPAWARGDALLLERVLLNLLDNAIKYTQVGQVTLALAEARDDDGRPAWTLSVRDTGPGIPPDEHERVFEEFYQLGNAARDRRHGLGLGLSIVRRLAGLMDLDLRMESVPGLGTRFTMRLPACEPPAPEVAARAHEPVEAVSLRGLSVLVVDDEPAVRCAMQAVLRTLGCEVALAAGLAEAEACAERARPDLVLADFRLRDEEDGIALVARLRERHPGLPALLVSGDTAPDRLREARAAGLVLLHKPLHVDVLAAAMRRAVDGE